MNASASGKAAVFALATFAVVGRGAAAATVNWGPATTIAGDADVTNAGTVFAAANFGDATVTPTTVNGVPFAAFPVGQYVASAAAGRLTVQETLAAQGYRLVGSDTIGRPATATSAPFANLSAAYRALIGPGIYSIGTSDILLTVSGLTPGAAYRIQLFDNVASANTAADLVNGTAGRRLRDNTTGADGGLGQFVTGTFTADATTQSVTITGDAAGGSLLNYAPLPVLNAVAVTAVPEPTAAAAAAAVGLSLFVGRRRRQR